MVLSLTFCTEDEGDVVSWKGLSSVLAERALRQAAELGLRHEMILVTPGTEIATRIPIIAMTIKSSIRVNPFLFILLLTASIHNHSQRSIVQNQKDLAPGKFLLVCKPCLVL